MKRILIDTNAYAAFKKNETDAVNTFKTAVVHNDLDHLAGTWSNKDYKEFQKKIKDFETIDATMWK